MRKPINPKDDPFKNIHPCVVCGTETDTQAFNFDQIVMDPGGAAVHLVGGLCPACIAELRDPARSEAAGRKMADRLIRSLDATAAAWWEKAHG
jgi:hypothetical protein